MGNIAGRGRKRPLLDISPDKLHIDINNPRFSNKTVDKSEKEILLQLYKEFDLRELAESMSKNGYLDEEPLVAIPKNLPSSFEKIDSIKLIQNEEYNNYLNDNSTQFIVVEGNRRLATVKLLLSESLRNDFKIKDWPLLTKEVNEDLLKLPVIIYKNKDEVVPYLGVRHIIGIKKWEPYAKAKYIASLIDQKITLDEIRKRVGDQSSSIKLTYLCYILVQIMEKEVQGSIEKAKNLFSYLLLALGQGPIKEYIGLENLNNIDFKNPIKKNKIKNLIELFSILFGAQNEKTGLIRESRDITKYLSPILRNKESTNYLINYRNLYDAYERSDGDEELLLKNLNVVNRKLESSLGIIHRHKNNKIIKDEVSKCNETIHIINNILGIK